MTKSAQRKQSVLDLPGGSNGSDWGSSLVPYQSSQFNTRDERKIDEEYRKQILVIGKQAEKTMFGQTMIMEIHEHAAERFYDAIEFIFSKRAEARGQEFQPYIDEFTHRQSQRLAVQLIGTLEVGANAIGQEINRTLYLTAEELGFLQRLFRRE